MMCKVVGCMGHPDLTELIFVASQCAQLICPSLGGNQAQCKHDANELLGHLSDTISAHFKAFGLHQFGKHF